MSIFSHLFGRKDNLTVSSDIKKEDARSRNIAFVDTEVGLKDHKIHDIGALSYDGATFHHGLFGDGAFVSALRAESSGSEKKCDFNQPAEPTAK